MPRRLIATFICLFALGACALLQPAGTTPLPGGGYWRPLPPEQLGRSLYAVQRVRASFGGHAAVLLFYLEVRGPHLALVATTPDGSELFSLEQVGTQVTVTSSPLLPAQLQPKAVLADLQMAFWPAAAVRKGLAGTGLTLDESEHAPGSVREIIRAGTVSTHIDYANLDPWRGTVEFDQRVWHYRYSVETVQLEP